MGAGIGALEQLVKRGNSSGNNEVSGKAAPVAAVMTAYQVNQGLLCVIRRGPSEIVSEQRAVPPSNLIIREIPYSIDTRFIRSDCFPGLGEYERFD
jgi:hypothetical protein